MPDDKYYYDLCHGVSEKSNCHTKKVGAVLVKDDIVICTGVNGPANGIPACSNRLSDDVELLEIIKKYGIPEKKISHAIKIQMCPREVMGFTGHQGLEFCNAIHAELNCLLSATRLGIRTKGATLYISDDETPCSQCFSACIQAGIKEIVLVNLRPADPTIEWCIANSDIIIRKFNI